MAVINNTPAINAVGSYEVATPFTVDDSAIYITQAIEGFESLEENGTSVFETYYQPLGIDQDKYDEDQLAGINIITLFSETAPVVHVPSSYITKFPTSGQVEYAKVIVSLDLGLLPHNLNIDAYVHDIEQRMQANTGVDATARTHLLPVLDVIDYSRHEQLENARLAAITFSETVMSENKRLLKENETLRERISQLEELVLAQQ